jgi:hypothetical protein
MTEDSGQYRREASVQRDIGAHEARLDNLETVVTRMDEKLDKLVAAFERNSGGVKVLAAVASTAAALAAGVAEFIHWLHGGHQP